MLSIGPHSMVELIIDIHQDSGNYGTELGTPNPTELLLLGSCTERSGNWNYNSPIVLELRSMGHRSRRFFFFFALKMRYCGTDSAVDLLSYHFEWSCSVTDNWYSVESQCRGFQFIHLIDFSFEESGDSESQVIGNISICPPLFLFFFFLASVFVRENKSDLKLIAPMRGVRTSPTCYWVLWVWLDSADGDG